MKEGKKAYRRSLGIFELVSLGLGGTIGSGIFVVPGIAAGIAGPSSLLAWLAVAISASCVTYSLAKSSLKYPSTGAFHSIFSKVFGQNTSTFLVILYSIASVFGIATIAAGIGQYLSFFGLGSIVVVVEIAVIAAFTLINIRGISLSGKTEIILTIAKLAPLLILAIVLIPHIRASNFSPPYPSASTDFLKVMVIVYWPFTGFEISAMPAEETKSQHTIFRSLKIVMAIVVVVYMLLNISLIGSMGSRSLADSPTPLATAAGLIIKQSESVVAVIGIIAMLSALNAYLVGTSRVLQNLSFQHNLRFLKELGSRGTPVAALILSAFATCMLLLFLSNHFQELASISVVATLVPYLFLCISTFKIFPTDSKTKLIAAAGALSTLLILVTYFSLNVKS
jgi:amino acid transporter